MDSTPTVTETAKQYLVEATKHHRGHRIQPTLQTRRRHVENAVGTDTGLEDVETSVCYSAGYAASGTRKWHQTAFEEVKARLVADPVLDRTGFRQTIYSANGRERLRHRGNFDTGN